MKDMELKIKQVGAMQEVHINGEEVSSAVHGVDLSFKAGCLPEVLIHPAISMVDVTTMGEGIGQMYVNIPDDVREMLVALGWTPPDDPSEAMVYYATDEEGEREIIDHQSPDYHG